MKILRGLLVTTVALAQLCADQTVAQLSAPTAPAVSIAAPLTIKIAGVLLCEPGGQTSLGIQIAPTAAVPANSFLRIRGIPSAVSLSDGHAIAPGAWAVPLDVVSQLHLKAPVAAQSKSELSLTLFSIEGRILAEAKSTLLVAPAGLISTPAPKATQEAAPPTATAPPLPGQRNEALRFVERAEAQMKIGAIVAARALLERAADMGLPDAAMALAGTYDAWELPRLGVVGVRPDPAAARKWYIRANELGALGAAERLRRLPP